MFDVEKSIKIASLLIAQNRFQQLGWTLIGIGALGITAVELTDVADPGLMNNDDAYTNFESWIDVTCWTMVAGGALFGIGLVAPVYHYINLLRTISSGDGWQYIDNFPDADEDGKEGLPEHRPLSESRCTTLSEWALKTATQWVGTDPHATEALRPLLDETQDNLFSNYNHDMRDRSF